MYGAGPVPDRMTMDDVVVRTGMCLGLLAVFASLGGAVVPVENFGPALGTGIAAMVLGLVIALQRSANRGYQLKIIKVTERYARVGMAMVGGFCILLTMNLVLGLFGVGDGFGDGAGFRTGGLGLLMGVVGATVGAFLLSLDFKQVEDGVAAGAPSKQAWVAAFGLTLSLVWIYVEWIYVELLRLLSSINGRS